MAAGVAWVRCRPAPRRVRAEVVRAPEKTHSQIMQQFGLPDDTIAPAVFAFLRRVLSDATDPARTKGQ